MRISQSHLLHGSTSFTSIGICRILLPCPWYNFCQNVISSSVGGSDYLRHISSKSFSICAKMLTLETDIGTTGQKENIMIAYAAHSLTKAKHLVIRWTVLRSRVVINYRAEHRARSYAASTAVRVMAVCTENFCWRVYCYRQACAKRSHAGIAFTQWSKNGFFAPYGRHITPINVKIHVYRGRSVGMQPPKLSNFRIFVINFSHRGDSFAQFLRNSQRLYASLGRF